MALCFPAYFGDPRRKAQFLAGLAATDWAKVDRLEDAWQGWPGWQRGWAVPVHDGSGFPAGIVVLAAALYRRLPADRRGRFLQLLFEAADAGADLDPVPERFLAALAAQVLPDQPAPAHGWALPVIEGPPALERLLAGQLADAWEAAAERLIETVAAARP